MSSGIGNLRLMRALGKVLGVNDVKQAPARLKTDELIPVVGLDPGMAGYEPWQTFGIGRSLAGISQAGWVIVGNAPGSVIFTADKQADNGESEFAIMGLRVVITYPDAAAILDEGQTPVVSYFRQATPQAQAVEESYLELGVIELVGGPAYYIHSIPMYLKKQAYQLGDPGPSQLPVLNIRPIWVPAGSVFGLGIAKTSGAVFPAGVTADVQAWGVKCPRGFRPPGI